MTSARIASPVVAWDGDVTQAHLLDLCIRQVPGYMWAVHGNVVHVYGDEEWRQPSNMLNLPLPSFEIHDETLGEAERRLRIKLLLQKGRLGGIAGVHGVTLELEQKRLRLEVQNVTAPKFYSHRSLKPFLHASLDPHRQP